MSTDLFLDKDELYRLTGYRQHKKQIEQLRSQRIPFTTNGAGHPRVVRAVLEGRKVANPAPKREKSSWSPSWAASPARI